MNFHNLIQYIFKKSLAIPKLVLKYGKNFFYSYKTKQEHSLLSHPSAFQWKFFRFHLMKGKKNEEFIIRNVINIHKRYNSSFRP